MLRVSLAAERGSFGVLSTGEKLAAAMVLNRHDWLAEMDYTIGDAIRRLGRDWVDLVPKVASAVAEELERVHEAATVADTALKIAALKSVDRGSDRETTVDLQGKFVTHVYAPGYRDIGLVLTLSDQEGRELIRSKINLTAADAEAIAESVRDVQKAAWRRGPPLDAKEGEQRPHWLGSR